MKKFSRMLAVLVIILTTVGQKDGIAPSKLNHKDKVVECKKCEGGWEISLSV